MRAAFAIAPLALMLAWLNPHPGTPRPNLVGTPTLSWAMNDLPASEPAQAASLPMVAYRSAPKDAATRPVSSNLLLDAAVVR